MNNFTHFYLFFYFCGLCTCQYLNLDLAKDIFDDAKQPGRLNRGSCLDGHSHFYRRNILENGYFLFIFIVLMIILFLLLLGLIKAIIGHFCSKKVGESGLGLLVDLPKPLEEYQEKSFRHVNVEYDIAGWPIDPSTKERTVRVLSMRTEFCLNVIFFMAYPLALFFKLCAICCCIRNYGDKDKKAKFRSINVIRFDEKGKCKEFLRCMGDKYKDYGTKEAEDTDYVVGQMHASKTGLKKSSK